MAIELDVTYSNQTTLNVDRNSAFEYLSDIKTNVGDNFPGILSITPESNSVWRWLFEKLSYGGYELQLQFRTRITPKAPDTIIMTSESDPSGTQLSGEWQLSGNDTTKLNFSLTMKLSLPLPFFVKSMAGPVVQKELTKVFDRYLSHVAKNISK